MEVVTGVSEAITGVSEVVTGVPLTVAVVLMVSVTHCKLSAVCELIMNWHCCVFAEM